MATLNYFFQHNLTAAMQIRTGNFVALFNIPDLLLSRGFEGVSEGVINDTLLSVNSNEIFNLALHNTAKPRYEFIELFNQKDIRGEIRKMIFEGESPSNPLVSRFLFEATEKNKLRYAKTFELLFAYLAIEKLKALSASFGVLIKDAPNGGDFDCIANFQSGIVYFEAKSGNVSNLKPTAIQKFLDRHAFLAPSASILFLDFEGGDSKLDQIISQFKNKNIGTRSIERKRKIKSEKKKLYVIESDVIILDIHNDGNILSNLRFALQYIHRYNAVQKNLLFQGVTPELLGYASEIL